MKAFHGSDNVVT